jgi:hypothetical protein
MGQTRPKYGGVVVKKTEQKGKLGIHVVPWRDLITDTVDIKGGVKIERHFYSPAELMELDGTWNNVQDAIDTATKNRSSDTSVNNEQNRTLGANIEVWEVHGVLPLRYLDEDAEEHAYARQMHIVVLDESADADGKDKCDGVCLYSGKEKSDPYKYLPWEEVDGRGLGIGVIEDCFEAQVWTNYGEKVKKDMLDLAGKMIFQTTDQNIAAKNILTDMENGTILTVAPNTSVSQVNNGPNSFAAFEKLIADWDTQAERVTSTFSSKTGETMPSGTPFRLAAMLNGEAGSMFVYRLQEAGLFVQEIYQDWVLPFLVKQIMKEDELVADLTDEELQAVVEDVAQHEAVEHMKEQMLSGKIVTPQDFETVKAIVRDAHANGAKRRAFKIPKNFFQDDYNVDVITTGEQKNKSVMLETLFNIFQVVARTPQLLQDPILQKLFNQIVELAGVSPLMFKMPAQGSTPAAPGAPAPDPAATPSPFPQSVAPQQTAV